MLKGNEGPDMVCWRCSKHVDPRCGYYWFLMLVPRGRCQFPEVTEARAVLCGFCGRELREYLEAGCYAPGTAYRRHILGGGQGYNEGGPGLDCREDGGAEGYGGLAEALGSSGSVRVGGDDRAGGSVP